MPVSWLELDTGRGFDTEIVVKVNVAEVLQRGTLAGVLGVRTGDTGHQYRSLPAG